MAINILQQVITYQRDELAAFQNATCLLSLSNNKYKDFENKPGNLGSAISFDLNPRATVATGLVASFQNSEQLQLELICDQAFNASRKFTAQEFIFNVDDYMEKFGRADVVELANQVEINLGLNIISAVPENQIVNGQTVPTGNLHTQSGPYRFADYTTSGLTSYQQLQQTIVNYRNFSSANDIRCVLPDVITPGIIGSGLNQFAPNRNNDLAMSWELGSFGTPPVKYYSSNLLPVHTSGTLGQARTTLTVVSTNDPTGANITEITCSGAGTDNNAIKSGDLGYFLDVSGQTTARALTYVGHHASSQSLQFRVTSDAVSSAGNVTFEITLGATGIVSTPASSDRNSNVNITAGMQIQFIPSHRAGIVMDKDSFFVAMPELPDEQPFPTSSAMDKATGVSMRLYYGSLFGKNQRGLIHDETHGAVIVPYRSMRLCLPV
jgi:hypothetical protein